jgi:2-phosphoxylose phosphatase
LYFSTSCQSGDLVLAGLEDSIRHGRDLYEVYGDMLGIIPQFPNDELTFFRTTPTTLTNQVAGGIIKGMFHGQVDALKIYQQPSNFDSLAPDYSCPFADNIRDNYQNVPAWFEHLNETLDFQANLSSILGVQGNSAWLTWYDHFFDTFSTRTCNLYPLPCNVTTGACVDADQAEQVFRLGDYEYNYIYNSAQNVTEYNAYHYGVWIGELLDNLGKAVNGTSSIQYRHNVAHDSSMAPLLGNLGITFLRWPGLGSELSFELWESSGEYFMRVLYGGQPLQTTWGGALSWIPYESFVSQMAPTFPSDIFTQCSG